MGCLQEHDIPGKIAGITVQSWRSVLSRKYNIYIFKWVQFCSERNFSLYERTINKILLFLYDLFQSEFGYSAMNTARSLLSTFINIDGVPVGQRPVMRCGEILSVLDIRNLDLSENICVVRIGDILKTFGHKSFIGEIKFYACSNSICWYQHEHFIATFNTQCQ